MVRMCPTENVREVLETLEIEGCTIRIADWEAGIVRIDDNGTTVYRAIQKSPNIWIVHFTNSSRITLE